ncbi:hypothetical protein L1987_43195 [Smallanthus sonchifolius]|uniref:Uncharacterized protein n=1 Tax=Smallanthus sonchifolius TaxID=185202 RepID=A0ACB9GKR6_9ASTR|nr:hypothetical protein L1987_43195 [Smallanthus sonchifolius]
MQAAPNESETSQIGLNESFDSSNGSIENYLSTEALHAIQSLKLAAKNASKLNQVFNSKLNRLLKDDLLDVFAELQRQQHLDHALKVMVSKNEIESILNQISVDDWLSLETESGIILKMASCVTKVGSSQERKIISGSVNKTRSRTLIIPSKVRCLEQRYGLQLSMEEQCTPFANESGLCSQKMQKRYDAVPIRTVNRQCSSGLQAFADVVAYIKAGFYEIGIGVGVESMSIDQIGPVSKVDPKVEKFAHARDCLLPMGITSENVAQRFGVTRQEQDQAAIKKLSDHIHVLEDKLQHAYNENAKLKVKQREDEKLWRGLESKLSSTKAIGDQLTETLQTLADQVQNGQRFIVDL